MTGPLTAVARAADSDDIAAGEAIASPGTSASARTPRRATFRKARLRIACPPSCEQLNENESGTQNAFEYGQPKTTGCSPPLDLDVPWCHSLSIRNQFIESRTQNSDRRPHLRGAGSAGPGQP